MKRLLLTLMTVLSASFAFGQGVTTSAVAGKMTDASGEPLGGASIVAVHQPTGSTYGAATDFDGFFRISNMRSGGPYRISFSYIGFETDVRENVYLTLGRASQFNIALDESATALEEVVVTGTSSGIFGASKTGSETTVSNREVQTLPATSRSLADFVRIT
ncbi:MAG: carboxypeptidase regulatory-like domain-containing protein, partial [Robiginitalea sp.]